MFISPLLFHHETKIYWQGLGLVRVARKTSKDKTNLFVFCFHPRQTCDIEAFNYFPANESRSNYLTLCRNMYQNVSFGQGRWRVWNVNYQGQTRFKLSRFTSLTRTYYPSKNLSSSSKSLGNRINSMICRNISWTYAMILKYFSSWVSRLTMPDHVCGNREYLHFLSQAWYILITCAINPWELREK